MAALLERFPLAELRRVQGEVWRRLAFHVDGLAALWTWELLHRHGLLARLAPPGATVGELEQVLIAAGHPRVNPGCLLLALRSLLNQGWAATVGPALPQSRWQLTAAGQSFFAAAGALAQVPRLLAAARAALGPAGPAAEDALAAALELAAADYGLEAAAPERFRHQLEGPLAASLATTLVARGWPLEESLPPLPEKGRERLAGWLAGWLRRQGWTDAAGKPAATAAIVALLASHYWYPLSYLATLSNLEELYFGDPRAFVARSAEGGERHLDRELDIRFSGRVFAGPIRQPFLAQVLAVFSAPRASQPEAVIDIGAGDGSMLRETWSAIAAATAGSEPRGERPLLAVAVEPSSAARRRSGANLRAAALPHVVLEGDIAAPRALAELLTKLGIDPENCLYLCKSVFHNRPFRPPAAGDRPGLPETTGAFLGGDGESLPGAAVVGSLIELFEAWRPFWRRHGMVAIEAHTVPAGQAAALQGRSPLTCLELLHGYSQQLLLEPEVHRAAARAAGLTSLASAAVGVDEVGYTALTVDHWRARG